MPVAEIMLPDYQGKKIIENSLFSGYLVAEAQWLGQYQEEIPKAQERLQKKTVPYRPVKGFIQHEKT